MTETASFHSWIHHDCQADSKTQSSTKSQVFRHVAAHRKMKRQQRTLRLRASALDVLKTLQVPCKDLPLIDKHFSGTVDPFDTLPIPTSLQIENLIHFDRVHLSPALNTSKITITPSPEYLQDPLAVHGHLARIAAVKWRCCGDQKSYDIMLKFKAEAMQKLRVNLLQTEMIQLPRAVMALMFTENWCRNNESAVIHVRLSGSHS